MWGRGTVAGRLATVPGRSPRPSVVPNSSPASKSSWKPTQIPSSQAPWPRASCKASSRAPRRVSRGGRKAPTPGNTRQLAAAMVAGSRVISAVAPTCSRARTRFPRFPTPASITTTGEGPGEAGGGSVVKMELPLDCSGSSGVISRVQSGGVGAASGPAEPTGRVHGKVWRGSRPCQRRDTSRGLRRRRGQSRR